MQARIIDTRTGERKSITGDGIDLKLELHQTIAKRDREDGKLGGSARPLKRELSA